MEKVKEAAALISKIRTAQETEKAELKKRISAAEETKEKNKKLLDQSQKAMDIDSFLAIQEEIKKADDFIRLADDRISYMNNSQLITADQFDEICKGIFTELKEEEKAAAAKILDLFDEMAVIADTFENSRKNANFVLSDLHCNIFRDPAIKKNPLAVKKYNNHDLEIFVDGVKNSGGYDSLQALIKGISTNHALNWLARHPEAVKK